MTTLRKKTNMAKNNIDIICKRFIDEINAKTKFNFISSRPIDTFTCKLKNLNLAIVINIKFDNDRIDKVRFTLAVNDEMTKDLQLDELISRLQLIHDYAKDDSEYYECCFCKRLFKGYGNNPQPVEKRGKCCNECNEKIVIPARLKELYS